jgi:membrane-bound lytic murein transglycosylase A
MGLRGHVTLKGMRPIALLLSASLVVLPAAAQPTPDPSASPEVSIQPAALPLTWTDDQDKDSLLLAIQRQIQDLQGQPDARIKLGERGTTRRTLLRTLQAFAAVVRDHHGKPSFAKAIQQRFQVTREGAAYVTGYYLPLLQAREQRTGEFIYPLHRFPAKDRHYPRAAIENGALAHRGLELAWVSDPFARYSLMVQGSGLLQFPDGRVVNINYAGSNGFPYQSLGRIFIDEGLLTEETLSWQAIRAYLQVHPEKRDAYFNRNQSYCFFKLNNGGPFGLSRIPLTAGRSIATDKRRYPAGALAYLSVPEHHIGRFVIDQDTGGAIKGKARVDLYLGGGSQAEELAGVLKHPGDLTYLLVKPAAK